MRILLDTHLLLWALASPRRLDPALRARLEDPGHEILFSAASIWEIAIKSALRRPDFTIRPAAAARAARDIGFAELPIDADTAATVAGLPPHHRDPFDRLLVAQAIASPAFLYTADPALAPYSELVRLVEPRPA